MIARDGAVYQMVKEEQAEVCLDFAICASTSIRAWSLERRTAGAADGGMSIPLTQRQVVLLLWRS